LLGSEAEKSRVLAKVESQNNMATFNFKISAEQIQEKHFCVDVIFY
jgi:hypothetical protein